MNKKKRKSYDVTHDNIFSDLGLENSEELLVRSDLLRQVAELIKASKLTQQQIAAKLGISQPKVSMLINGRLSEFSTESLMHYLAILGCKINIRITVPKNIFKHQGRVAVCNG